MQNSSPSALLQSSAVEASPSLDRAKSSAACRVPHMPWLDSELQSCPLLSPHNPRQRRRC